MSLLNNKIHSTLLNKPLGTGWLSPLPDLRDYSENTPAIQEMTNKLGINAKTAIPAKADLRSWCPPVEDQGQIGSCTANAAIGMIEYFENRAFGKYIDGSRLFVYKTTRNLMKEKGDTGAYLRNAMGALVLCGVPPEKYWPYTDKTPAFDQEPAAFVYSVAQQFKAVKYFCHDPFGQSLATSAVLESVKKHLAAGVPAIFGFYGFPSYEKSDVPGGIPYPAPQEQAEWGHAIMAVGFDDKMKIKNTVNQKETTGALLFRNSWSKAWGDQGYGWLPYQYVLDGLAEDFWSLLSMDWVDTKQFGL